MLKKTILIIILICTILTAGLAYLNEVLLPTRFKKILVEKITQKIGRDISVADLRYVPLKGLVLTEVQVFEKNQKKQPFLSISEVSVSILYAPALLSKKVIIPSLVIKNPIIRITKQRNGEWNFSDLLPKKLKNKETKDKIQAYIGGVEISKGILIFSDKKISREPIETIENINLSCHLALPKSFKVNIKIMPSTKNPLKLISSINYKIDLGDFMSTCNIKNLSLKNIAPYIKTKNINLKNSHINLAAFNISRRNKKTLGKGKAMLGKTSLSTLSGKHMEATPSISIDQIIFENKALLLSGRVRLDDGILTTETNKKFQGDLSYDFHLKKKERKTNIDGALSIENLKVSINQNIDLKGTVQGQAKITEENNISTIQVDAKVQDTEATLPNERYFSGSPSFHAKIILNPNAEKIKTQYSGTIDLTLAKLTNLPHVGDANNIQGKLKLENNNISSSSLSALIHNTLFKISGNLKNLQNPILDITGTVPNINFSEFKTTLKQFLSDPGLDLKGQGSVKFKYQGNQKTIKNSSVEVSAVLKNAAIKTTTIPSGISDISGEISYAVKNLSPAHFLPDNGSWKNLKGTFKNQEYKLDGSIASNNITSKILINNLTLNAQIKLMLDRFKINSLTIKYEEIDLLAQGEILYPKSDQWDIDVDIDGRFGLENFLELSPFLNKKFKNLNPKGKGTIKSSFTGDPRKWKDWAFFAKITSDKISIKDYELKNVSIKYDQRDDYINQCSILGTFYDGDFSSEASADLSIKEMPYKIVLNIKNLNLEKLKNATPIKDKDLFGTLQLSYEGNGPLSHILFSKGKGFASIDQGELWHIDLLKGLGQLLFVPEYQNITFDNAQSKFEIKNEKVFIKDGILRSNQMKLDCNGTINFKGQLDLDVLSKFERDALKKTQSLQKAIAVILNQANSFLTVKITGTLEKPKYFVVPSTSGMIKKTRDLIDNLPSIFE